MGRPPADRGRARLPNRPRWAVRLARGAAVDAAVRAAVPAAAGDLRRVDARGAAFAALSGLAGLRAASIQRCSSAASNALAIACLLLPALTASPTATTACPGLASRVNCSAVPRRAR